MGYANVPVGIAVSVLLEADVGVYQCLKAKGILF